MKQISALAAISVLALSLTACGENPPSPPPSETQATPTSPAPDATKPAPEADSHETTSAEAAGATTEE